LARDNANKKEEVRHWEKDFQTIINEIEILIQQKQK